MKLQCGCERIPSKPGYWRAEAWVSHCGNHGHIHYVFLETIRETSAGAWVVWVDGSTVWRKFTTLCKTREEALQQLFHRKASHVKHARRRYYDAKAQWELVCKTLGRDSSIHEPLRLPDFPAQLR